MSTVYVLILFLALLPTHPEFDVKNPTVYPMTQGYYSLQDCENEALRIFIEDMPIVKAKQMSIVHLECKKIGIPTEGA